MARKKKRVLQKPAEKENFVSVDKSKTQWDKIQIQKIPYASHIPENPSKMTEERKIRIRKVMYWYNHKLNTMEIAKKMGIDVRMVRRDLTTAVALTKQNMPYVPKIERQIMKATATYTEEAKELMDRVKNVIDELETSKMYQDPKGAMSFAMLLGELRQTLELGAKLTGELQTGTRVNVVMFTGLVKKLISIIETEVDRTTFLRIRDRFRLEMQGQEPLGSKGGTIEIEAQEVLDQAQDGELVPVEEK